MTFMYFCSHYIPKYIRLPGFKTLSQLYCPTFLRNLWGEDIPSLFTEKKALISELGLGWEHREITAVLDPLVPAVSQEWAIRELEY